MYMNNKDPQDHWYSGFKVGFISGIAVAILDIIFIVYVAKV